MKKAIFTLILPLVVVGGLVFANSEINNEKSEKIIPKPVPAPEKETAVKKWEDTPEGIKYSKWKASPDGTRVLAGAAKLSRHIKDSTNMEAVVTSLSLPPGSRLGFGVMVRIDEVDYIVRFDLENSQLRQLQTLEVNDKIILKARGVSHAPKYAYPIISGEYVERDGKMIYKRIPPKGGC